MGFVAVGCREFGRKLSSVSLGFLHAEDIGLFGFEPGEHTFAGDGANAVDVPSDEAHREKTEYPIRRRKGRGPQHRGPRYDDTMAA